MDLFFFFFKIVTQTQKLEDKDFICYLFIFKN